MRTVSSGLMFNLVLSLLLFFPPFFIVGFLAVPAPIPANQGWYWPQRTTSCRDGSAGFLQLFSVFAFLCAS